MPLGQPYNYVATIWSFGERATVNAGVTRFMTAPGNTGLTTELAAIVVLRAGTLQNLRWSCQASTLGGTGHLITVFLNGTATPLIATWNGSATSGVGTADLVPVVPGDTVSVRIKLAGVAGQNMNRPRVSIEQEVPSAIPWLAGNGADMYYNGGGRVSIGTDKGKEALSVFGAVEAMEIGFRFPDGTLQKTAAPAAPQAPMGDPMPPGAVIAYAGPTAPAGWLLCDGSLLSRTDYALLFLAIGIAHGEGDGSTTFALPDYRGTFLRGVDWAGGVDVERDARTAQGPGGNTGNAVGSRQGDSLQPHAHSLGTGKADSWSMVVGGATGRLAHFKNDEYSLQGQHATSEWPPYGVETRPKNTYVHFLIKS